MRSERISVGADLALLAVAAIWGLTFTAVQRALEDAGAFSFLTARFLIAVLVLAVVFPKRAFRLNRRVVLLGGLIGLWLTAGYSLQTVGLLYTTASKSAFITGVSVVLTPLLSFAVSRVRPHASSVGAVGLAVVGLYLLASPDGAGANVGDVLTLGCAVAFALHIVTTERVAPRHDPVALAFSQIATAALASGLLMALVEGPRLALTPWTLSALVVTGVFATAVAFAVQMWAQRRTSATHVAVIFTAEPMFAALFAWVIRGEVLGVKGILGGASIIAGILIAQLGARGRAASGGASA